jgi:hypothetical protein
LTTAVTANPTWLSFESYTGSPCRGSATRDADRFVKTAKRLFLLGSALGRTAA